jgi:hypothetical protein
MTDMTDEVTRLESDLDEARAELHQTLEQINHKVETQFLRPDDIVRRHMTLSIGLAGLAGFAAGLSRDRAAMLGAFGTGLLIGFAIMRHLSRGEPRDN